MRNALFLSCMLVAESAFAGGVPKILPLENGKPITIAPIAPNDKLQYYGGRVLSNVEVVEVAWGSGTNPNYLNQLEGFYKAILKSSFMDWMSEYDTIGLIGYVDKMPGTNQHIGRGTFAGTFVITPDNKSTMLTDSDVLKELVGQLNKNAIPQPKTDSQGNVNTLYMIDFPPGVGISLVNIYSCSSFGAYHFTFTYKGNSVPYGVHPDCGYNFDQSTMIHSHELAEAMTDMEVGLVEYNTTNPSARPLAWVTVAQTAWASYESADLCSWQPAKIAGYTVQKVWSNYAKACVAEIPICDPMSNLVPPACRPCNEFDSGNACADPKPACATSGTEKGHCVKCTTKYPNACPMETPICDEPNYACVGCLKDADCKGATPICDLQTKTCKPCTQDSECGVKKCDTQMDAKKGQCVECSTDFQCALDEQCLDHTCIRRPPFEAGLPPDTIPIDIQQPGCSCNDAKGAPSPWGLAGLALLLLRRRGKKRA